MFVVLALHDKSGPWPWPRGSCPWLHHWLLVSSDIWSLYTLRYHISQVVIISFDRFCWSSSSTSSVYSDILCIICSSSPKVQYCTRPVELPDFWPPNSPCLSTFHYNIWDSQSTRKKRRMWMLWGGICLIRELECNRALLTMALISGADVSMPVFELQEDIWLFTMI